MTQDGALIDCCFFRNSDAVHCLVLSNFAPLIGQSNLSWSLGAFKAGGWLEWGLREYHTCSMLAFTPITEHKAGILAALLLESYAEVVCAEQQYWLAEEEKWLEFDREVFGNPQTIGQCVFITMWEGEVIGFGSFDPRQRPESATIGHNCIVPRFQGRGYGRQQVIETLDRIGNLGVKKAIVSTNEHPFFAPAQRMYLSCGFEESRRYIGGPDPRYRMIEYRREVGASGDRVIA